MLWHTSYSSNGVAITSNYRLAADGSGNAVWSGASGAVSYASNSNDVAIVGAGGASTLVSRADHVHRGVTSISHTSNTFYGPVTLTASGTLGITSPASGTFNLSATGGAGGGGTITTKDEGSTLSSAVTTLDFVGAGVVASGAGVTTTVTIAGASGTTWNGVCNGRLTLTSGLAVTTADVTAATTLYFTPYKGNQIGTYSGAAWTVSTFTEKSITLASLTANSNYDCFIVDSTLALELLIWTNATTRATALVDQDGVWVKSGATTRRYLGTIRITGTTGQCEDSLLRRLVWNNENRLIRQMRVVDATDTWTYGTNAYRQARASAANQVDYVCGLSEDRILADLMAGSYSDAAASTIPGIGVDSTTANSAQIAARTYGVGTSGTRLNGLANYRGFPGIGYHYLAWLEKAESGVTVTYYGDDGVAGVQSGLMAEVWG